MSPIKYDVAAALGPQTIEGVFHGSVKIFPDFKRDGYNSLGIHFGDIEQAKHFAKADGQIIKADLNFENLLDIKNTDLGWTTEKMITLVLKSRLQVVGEIHEEHFAAILEGIPDSTFSIEQTTRLEGAATERLVRLLDAHGVDGIKYRNNVEPPGRTGGTAYFVLRDTQIRIVDRDSPVSGKFS